MRLTRSIAEFVFAAFIPFLITGQVAAKESPEKIEITRKSKNGAILVKVDTIPADFQLWFQKVQSSGFGSRVYMIKVAAEDGRERYVSRTLSPGKYRLDSIWQQKRFGLLLSHDTFDFEIKSGIITYIGKLNTLDLLLKLQKEAVAANRTVAVGTSGFSTDRHGIRPVLVERTTSGLGDAESFAMQLMHAQHGMVELGEVHDRQVIK